MNPKKILIVSYVFPPAFSPGAIRVERFAHYLTNLGHDVTVLTCANPYSSMMTSQPTDDGNLPYKIKRTRDLIDKTVFSGNTRSGSVNSVAIRTRFKRALSSIFSPLLFPDRDITWVPTAVSYIAKQNDRYDVVLASYPGGSNLVLGSYAAKKLGAHFVADIRDLWTEQVKARKLSVLSRMLEKHVLKRARMIVTISENNTAIMQKAWPGTRVVTIYNGYEPSHFPPRVPDDAQQRFVITYAGSFNGGVRNPRPFLCAIAQLKNEKVLSKSNFEFNIIGHVEQHVQNAVEELGLCELVKFHGLVDRAVVYEALAASNVLLAITGTIDTSAGEMTTKVFEYIGIGRKILCLTKPEYEIARVLGSIDGAICADVDDKEEIELTVAHLLSTWMQNNCCNSYFDRGDEFSRERLAEKLSCEIQKL